MKVYDLRPDELPLLAEYCRTIDSLGAMREALAVSGVMVAGSKGQPRPNPLLTEIRGSQLVLARLAGQLGLPDEDEQGSRTPAQRRAAKAARARWEGAGHGAA